MDRLLKMHRDAKGARGPLLLNELLADHPSVPAKIKKANKIALSAVGDLVAELESETGGQETLDADGEGDVAAAD